MLISSDVSIVYDQPTTGAMIDVGDVGIGEDIVYPNEVLMYDSTTEGGKWNHVLATEVKSKMGMGPDYNAEYANVTVNNILGQTVYATLTTTIHTIIDLSSFEKGIYTIELRNNKSTYTEKVIVE